MCRPALTQRSSTEASSSDRQKEANKVGEGGGNFNALFVFCFFSLPYPAGELPQQDNLR